MFDFIIKKIYFFFSEFGVNFSKIKYSLTSSTVGPCLSSMLCIQFAYSSTVLHTPRSKKWGKWFSPSLI